MLIFEPEYLQKARLSVIVAGCYQE